MHACMKGKSSRLLQVVRLNGIGFLDRRCGSHGQGSLASSELLHLDTITSAFCAGPLRHHVKLSSYPTIG